MCAQQRPQPYRLAAKFDPYRRLGGRAVIPLVKEQVKRPLNGRQARGEIGGVGDVERRRPLRELLLRALDALFDRSLRGDERARNFGDAEAAHEVQHERYLRFLGKTRLAAQEHHAKTVVFDRALFEQPLECRLEIHFVFETPLEFGREDARHSFPAQNVERAVLRGRHQPS